jgi:class 3 adenylate cyclase
MTRDDIIRMAREAGAGEWGDGVVPAMMDIERFAALVAAHEREECAKVANEWQTEILDPRYQCDCATAIRARGEK